MVATQPPTGARPPRRSVCIRLTTRHSGALASTNQAKKGTTNHKPAHTPRTSTRGTTPTSRTIHTTLLCPLTFPQHNTTQHNTRHPLLHNARLVAASWSPTITRHSPTHPPCLVFKQHKHKSSHTHHPHHTSITMPCQPCNTHHTCNNSVTPHAINTTITTGAMLGDCVVTRALALQQQQQQQQLHEESCECGVGLQCLPQRLSAFTSQPVVCLVLVVLVLLALLSCVFPCGLVAHPTGSVLSALCLS